MSTQIIKKEKQNNRIEWLDFARGLGVIFVVFGHSELRSIADYLVYPFHVPLFFFLSGLVFSIKNYSFVEFLAKKIKTIIIPYTFFSIIWIIYEIIIQIKTGNLNYNFIINEFKLYALQKHLHPIWFLTCLFIVEIIAYFIQKYIDNNCLLFVITVLFSIIGFLYYHFLGGYLPWCLDIVFTAMPFFIVGIIFKNSKEIAAKLIQPKFILLYGIGYIGIAALNIKISGQVVRMFSGTYGNFILFYISAFLGIGFTVALSKTFKKNIIINYIGENSLVIFSLHYIFMSVINSYISTKLYGTIVYITIQIIIVIVSIIITIGVNEIIIKTPLRWFVNGCKINRRKT